MIDHIGIQVTDVEPSLAFCLRTFAPIGIREMMRFPHGNAFVVGLSGSDSIPNFWLSPAIGTETRNFTWPSALPTAMPSTRSMTLL
jgi:hypothetical protein